ncbi:hypothetical protein TRFO_42225 [Tritrichomonas foetus]|uniref:Uncharacterized protein n=1 Tax=Tritrichomonas foetus TaxID=1144522 RepID=A0A1J4L1Q7_9EUKA|nr:hypothetical protein TRFO_42225 [Tritrichomonas foetus]|eukprot:OHT15900.1 hypothetical protein TRFO_42225 [Tritrichomonas foetus]
MGYIELFSIITKYILQNNNITILSDSASCIETAINEVFTHIISHKICAKHFFDYFLKNFNINYITKEIKEEFYKACRDNLRMPQFLNLFKSHEYDHSNNSKASSYLISNVHKCIVDQNSNSRRCFSISTQQIEMVNSQIKGRGNDTLAMTQQLLNLHQKWITEAQFRKYSQNQMFSHFLVMKISTISQEIFDTSIDSLHSLDENNECICGVKDDTGVPCHKRLRFLIAHSMNYTDDIAERWTTAVHINVFNMNYIESPTIFTDDQSTKHHVYSYPSPDFDNALIRTKLYGTRNAKFRKDLVAFVNDKIANVVFPPCTLRMEVKHKN